jgi:hypothetical protein
MKASFLKLLLALLFVSQISFGQEKDNAAILKVIFNKYYQNEKVIKKGRLQLLTFYCQKAPNNEEVFEVIAKNAILQKNALVIKKQVNDFKEENWSKEFQILFDKENQYLKSKVNDCLSLEEYQKNSSQFNLNNQRLLIVNKPIYFSNNSFALVKIAFYRNIEHNSGCFFLLEKRDGVWTIKETLNEWST